MMQITYSYRQFDRLQSEFLRQAACSTGYWASFDLDKQGKEKKPVPIG
jgi:hypothetical protein